MLRKFKQIVKNIHKLKTTKNKTPICVDKEVWIGILKQLRDQKITSEKVAQGVNLKTLEQMVEFVYPLYLRNC